jgi:flagellar protein FlaF
MAVAEIVGAAIGVLLLVVVAYLLVGNVIVTSEIVTTAQKDITLQHESRLRTALNISDQKISGNIIKFNVTNTGSETVSDFEHMDVYSYNNSLLGYQHYQYDKNNFGHAGNWTKTQIQNDFVHPNQLDPGEKMWCEAIFIGVNPVWLEIATGNGVYDSDII